MSELKGLEGRPCPLLDTSLGAMADNSTHPIVEILESFGLSKSLYNIYKAFSLTLFTSNIVLSTLKFWRVLKKLC